MIEKIVKSIPVTVVAGIATVLSTLALVTAIAIDKEAREKRVKKVDIK